MPGGAGGPNALQTSPHARRRKSVDTNPHAALAGLTCRASPANSSIAGGAALDSVRLRRNRSLLLCETQSSSLTCARGADRACTREKAGIPWKFHSRRCPRLRGRGPSRRDMLRGACRAWAREKAGMSWKFHSQCKKNAGRSMGGFGRRPSAQGRSGRNRTPGKRPVGRREKGKSYHQVFHLKLFNQPRSCQIDILLSNAQYNIDQNFFNSFDKKRSKFFVFLPDSPEKPLFHAVF